MRTEITKLHQRLQATMIYVTHDQIEAMTMGDRIVVMNNGKVQQTDTPLKLYNEPDNLFVAGFLGSPPMNLINGELKQERDAIVFKEIQGGTIQARFTDRPQAREFLGKPMVLGIRPEDIELAQISKTGNTAKNFPAIVDIVEPMGAETNLYLQTGAHTVVCRSASAHSITGRRAIACGSSSMSKKRICSIRRPQVVSSKGLTRASFNANLIALPEFLPLTRVYLGAHESTTVGRDWPDTQRLEIVNALKRSRGLSVNELVDRMRMSYMGIKQHCLTLQRDGYLDTWRRPQKMGRPEMVYR